MTLLGPFAALAYRFRIDVPDPGLARHVSDLLAGLAIPWADQTGELDALAMQGPDGPRLSVNEETVAGSDVAERLLPALFGHLNRRAVTRTSDRLLLLHAGAVSAGPAAVLLPAPAESGKTTLTAGLVARGLNYVTDEAVGIDPASLAVVPYAKPLSVDPGSWDALADLEPFVEASLRPLHSSQWQVSPECIRRGSVSGPSQPSLVVFPMYQPSSPTRLEEMSRADAVVELAQNSFNFHDRGRALLPVLAAVVARCQCYRLVVGDLSSACEEILALVDTSVRVPA